MLLEVEQKFPVQDVAATTARLTAAGISLGQAIRQVDTYYAHPARDFHQTDEAFRLRQVGKENYFTYKGPRIDQTTKTRHELEVPLAPSPMMAGQYQQLLTALGFSVGGVVSKSRREGHLLFPGNPGQRVEVVWDDVDGLGAYVELEIISSAEQLNSARAIVAAVAQQLQLGPGERRSYLELLRAKTA